MLEDFFSSILQFRSLHLSPFLSMTGDFSKSQCLVPCLQGWTLSSGAQCSATEAPELLSGEPETEQRTPDSEVVVFHSMMTMVRIRWLIALQVSWSTKTV